MATAQDFLQSTIDGDLLIRDGDIVVGPSDEQNQWDIIVSFPGTWKQFVNVGVGLPSYQNGDINLTALSSNIVTQLKQDGFSITRPKITIDPSTSTFLITTNASRS